MSMLAGEGLGLPVCGVRQEGTPSTPPGLGTWSLEPGLQTQQGRSCLSYLRLLRFTHP